MDKRNEIDPAREDAYWRDNYSDRPYVRNGSSYDDYRPAYRFGVDAAGRHPGRTFEDVESEMSRRWNDGSGESTSRWEHARDAVRDAWNRVNGTA